MKGHSGLQDFVPRKFWNDRSPILDESAINNSSSMAVLLVATSEGHWWELLFLVQMRPQLMAS